MKKVLMTIAAVISLTAMSYAQKGAIKLGIGAEVGIPTGDLGDKNVLGAKTGFGLSAKGLYGISEAGSIGLQVGALFHKGQTSGDKGTIIPIIASYHHNFNGFYVEPGVGFASYSLKGDGYSESASGFIYAITAGYEFKSIDFSARYQGGNAKFSGVSFSMPVIAFRVAYNFSLSGSTEKK